MREREKERKQNALIVIGNQIWIYSILSIFRTETEKTTETTQPTNNNNNNSSYIYVRKQKFTGFDWQVIENRNRPLNIDDNNG